MLTRVKNGENVLLCTARTLQLLRPTVLVDAHLAADALDKLGGVAEVRRPVLLGVHRGSQLDIRSQKVRVEVLQRRGVRLVRVAEHVALQAVAGRLVLLQLRGAARLLEVTCLAACNRTVCFARH